MFSILIGHKSSHDFFDPNDFGLFLRRGQKITPKVAEKLEKMGIRSSQVVEDLIVWMATGKKKQVVAWARVGAGEGKFLINGVEAHEHFVSQQQLDEVLTPFRIAGLDTADHDIRVKVEGSEAKHKRHRRAITVAIAGALVCSADRDKSLVAALEREGYRRFCYHILP